MSKLVIDLNSILSASILVGTDPEGCQIDDKIINTCDYGYDIFLTSLKSVLGNLHIVPKDIIGVFDAKDSRCKRKLIYPEYKQHRAVREPEYYQEFNKLMAQATQFIKELGGGTVSAKLYEADDVIAHIAPKLDAIIWSRDKDLLSIGSPMWLDNYLYERGTCEDKFSGIPRKYIRLYRTLVSDPGDFGPGMGAKGFGGKAFIKLFKIFGEHGLDLLIELLNDHALEELKEDVKELPILQKIIDSQDNVYTTWKLAAWLPIKDHQLIYDFDFVHDSNCKTFDMAFADYYNTTTLVTAENFQQIARQVKYLATESRYIAIDIETDTPLESKEWIKNIKENFSRPPITVDVYSSYLVGCSLTLGENSNRTFYFSIRHTNTNNIESNDLRDLVISLDKPLVAHNAGGFELPVLYREWGVWLPDVYCSLIAAKYVDENAGVGLKKLTKEWFGYIQTEYTEVTQGMGISELSAEHVLAYGADDTIMTAALFNVFEMIMDIEGTFDTYVDVEQAAMYMVAHAFNRGVSIDLDVLARLEEADKAEYVKNFQLIHNYLLGTFWPGAQFKPLMDFSAKEIKRGYKAAYGEVLKTGFRKIEKLVALMGGKELAKLILLQNLNHVNGYIYEMYIPSVAFKPGSPKDKTRLLYETMGAPVRFRKPLTDIQRKAGKAQGNICTDEDAVKWAILDVGEDNAKILKAVLRCQNYTTRNGLYYSAYKYLVHWEDGKLHPNLRQSSTTSRRFAPSGPNVNQLPKRSEAGRKIRECIVPHKKSALIVSPDFSGQELRLGAELTQDANFLACYVGDNKKDLHSVTAFAISKQQGGEFASYEEFVTALQNDNDLMHGLAKDYRTVKAKPTNFLSQYITVGGGAKTLAKKLQITEHDAELFLKAKSESFPGIDKWKVERGGQIRRQGYAETLLGARKHIAQLLHKMDADYVLRSALNFEIQGSGAEMLKLVLGKSGEEELLEKYDCEFYFPVHDEPCWSVDIPDIESFCKDFRPIMTQKYADMRVPIESNLAIGPNFGELTEVPWDGVGDFLKNNYEASMR